MLLRFEERFIFRRPRAFFSVPGLGYALLEHPTLSLGGEAASCAAYVHTHWENASDHKSYPLYYPETPILSRAATRRTFCPDPQNLGPGGLQTGHTAPFSESVPSCCSGAFLIFFS